eukprot:GHVU01108727.1.p2 GENE.GHVU01108727.1~~GHVU01108727.1.p2  ORF type:complete len:179 (+),score=22.65 GHVU01108727.1:130-666(+)
MAAWMHGWVCVWVCGCMDGWLHDCVGVWLHGWMTVCVCVCVCVCRYFAKLLGGELEHGVELLSDILLNSTYRERAVAEERDVVLREMQEIEKTTEELIFDNLHQAVQIYICMCVYIYACACVSVHPCMNACMNACVHECMYACVRIYESVYMYMCVWVGGQTCVCVCVCVCACLCTMS